MIGDGPERTTLESRVLQLGMESKVRFYGRLPDSELAQAYQGVRIAVIPSLAGEVFGLVVTENMARGLATVVSDIGAFSEVAGTAGITFPSGNPGALADHLAQLISDRDQIPSRGLEARLRVLHHFERSQMIAAHAALYRKAVTSR
jgi:glycosyltransferase involved in cell wall biosynthesis